MSEQAGFPGAGPNVPQTLTVAPAATLLPPETPVGTVIGFLSVTLPDGRRGLVRVYAAQATAPE